MASATRRTRDNETETLPATETGITGPVEDARLTTQSTVGHVVVGCKIPNGIILQLSAFEENTEPVMGGGHREVKTGRKVGEKYVVRGPAVKYGEIPKFLMVGGYALTSGIPEDFWNEWVRQNQDSDIVRRNLIIAFPKIEDLQAKCLENEKRLTGLEPMDPLKLPIKGIQTAPEMNQRR
jgi:hypothetical protein